MNKKIFFVVLLFVTTISYSQILEPVKWKTSFNKISDTEYDLVIEASIDKNWHLYSQTVPEDGPIPTTFSFIDSLDYQLIGEMSEPEGHTVNDAVFDMLIKYFEGNAKFIQRVKIVDKQLSSIKGEVEFMACDDASCLPPTYVDLVFQFSESEDSASEINYSIDDLKIDEIDNSVVKAEEEKEEEKSFWVIFIIAFFSGFAALLTPCVFPMIPLTVSFFIKQSKNKLAGLRNAIVYGLSIIIIYVLLGFLVSLIFGADALNALSTNVVFNIIFFLLLIVFGISFLGAFEITLPSSWGTKIDKQADKGGLMGIFFMALALAVVSFSCTGPIVGTLLVEAASGGNHLGPIIGMFGFALAIAIPFTLFAIFPAWLNSLPKSGGWLNTVKVVLGFLELGFAFKFLSNADLVLQLHWLEREVFLAIWIAVFGALALYLFGKIRLPHDSPNGHISVGRLGLGLISLSFTIYMIPGLWGAPLNLISAFPPAQHYSESPYGVGNSKQKNVSSTDSHSEIPDGAHLMPPHDILAFNDYYKGVEYAKKVNKPIMLDFTGHACVNCRKMEQNVWAKDKILPILKNDVVLISLYVDDKRPLPKGEEVDSELRPGKKLKYIGQKWSEFQTIKFGANAQPYYVLMRLDETNLNKPIAYTPDVDEYYNWLKEGISNFK